MNKNISVIEINGYRYDAVTGQLIGSVKRVAHQFKKRTTEPIIDGVRHRAVKSKQLGKQLHKTARSVVQTRSTKHPAQQVHQKPQRSHTLMRSAVTKPTADKHSQAEHQTGHNAARFSRAKTTGQHAKVHRFAHTGSQSKNPTASLVTGEVLRPQSKMASVIPSKSQAVAVTQPAANISHQQLERLLDHALAKADAHKQARRQTSSKLWGHFRRPRWLTVTLVLSVLVLLAGFFAWYNFPQLSMKIATMRAHINSSVPGYTPSGFSFKGPIRYNNGIVTLDFKANADKSREFSIKQQPSNWDSSSLASNAVPSNKPVQTSRVKGNTIYIYGENKKAATWVSNGIRYTIEDQANLNSDQLLKIAEGL